MSMGHTILQGRCKRGLSELRLARSQDRKQQILFDSNLPLGASDKRGAYSLLTEGVESGSSDVIRLEF